RLKDWDEFDDIVQYLMYSRKHLDVEEGQTLLGKLIYVFQHEDIIAKLEKIFRMILRNDEVRFGADVSSYGFSIDDEHAITPDNYEELRQITLRQNLLFEPKVYKNKLMQE